MKDVDNTPTAVVIDPSYRAFYGDKLFSADDPQLNRDGQLLPWIRLRAALNGAGTEAHTADWLSSERGSKRVVDYYSLGLLDNFQDLQKWPNVRLRAFLVMEPPAVAPHLYRALPKLTKAFERVYVHNTVGDGYSTRGVDMRRLRRLYWPQPHNDVLEPYWENAERQWRLVVINGNHIPRSFGRQLYGRRIHAMVALSKVGAVDLYGHGWAKWWSHRSMWPPYWINRRALMSIYRGSCVSKYAVLSQYVFSLCFENMYMEGYLTEKIFDCLYAGTIPVYLGAKDIDKLIPPDVYIDSRNYDSWMDLWSGLQSLSKAQVTVMKEAGRDFLRSAEMAKYYDSLPEIFLGNDNLGISARN